LTEEGNRRPAAEREIGENNLDKIGKRVLVLVLMAWVTALLILSRQHRSYSPTAAAPLVELPVYAGASQVQRGAQTTGAGEWQNLQYVVESGCPSNDIYRFYDSELGEVGWHPREERAPAWTTQGDGKESRLSAAWFDKDELFRIDLQVTCLGSHRMKVSCSMMRNPLPHSLAPSPADTGGK
jgi:hypothetical protein